ncbi:hypothetical protein RHMOL_Rhmol07G0029500 [Rhododendron molle]|uniref:Uncharacterized protein n=1 Tax=Rhododendron molle TaxID=49168 RepID=A0ACC0MXP1_RHOML|nr:hypothetical protein RHMOL_Rhmol07G0029500 [Rhododendron molle]
MVSGVVSLVGVCFGFLFVANPLVAFIWGASALSGSVCCLLLAVAASRLGVSLSPCSSMMVTVYSADSSGLGALYLQSHADFNEDQVNAFLCDVVTDDLCDTMMPSSINVVTFLSKEDTLDATECQESIKGSYCFVLLVIAIFFMLFFFLKIATMTYCGVLNLQPEDGHVLLRDYAQFVRGVFTDAS